MFDPYITPNKLAAHIDLQKIPADYMLLSHAHNDHVADALAIARRSGATVIGIFELCKWFEKNGINSVHALNIGGSHMFEFGTVKMVHAVHSSTFADGTPGGTAAGFLIQTGEAVFYFAGDTALHYDMKLLGKHYRIDFAFLPIGDNYTMGPDDAIIASRYIKCDKIIGMHYDTFGEIQIDHAGAVRKFGNEDKKLFLIPIGESVDM